MDAAARQSLNLDENAIDTSSSALGKRGRSLVEPMNVKCSTRVMEGIRSRWETPATTTAAGPAVAHAHAQWWSPDLEPKMEASPSATAGGVDGAISLWVADGRNRIWGGNEPRRKRISMQIWYKQASPGNLRRRRNLTHSPRLRLEKRRNKLFRIVLF